jgi:hypothetical protein
MFASEKAKNPILLILLAIGFLYAFVALFSYMETRTTAKITIPKVEIFAPHTTFAEDTGRIHEIGQAAHTEDDLYVAATLHLKNNINFPLLIDTIQPLYTDSTGATLEGQTISHNDLPRLEETFPALTPMLPSTFPLEIKPNATADGAILLHFPGLTADKWKARKSTTITLNFLHQPPITIPIP